MIRQSFSANVFFVDSPKFYAANVLRYTVKQLVYTGFSRGGAYR